MVNCIFDKLNIFKTSPRKSNCVFPGVKMLVSATILAATKEPILTAFSVSNKLFLLAKRREEYRDIYTQLAKDVSGFKFCLKCYCNGGHP